MKTFIYIGRDSEQGAELRKQIRDQHLEHLRPHSESGRVIFGGPLRDESGNPCGSLIIVQADDLEAARAIAHADPYFREGVFKTIEVFETMMVFPESGS
ncbi:MAG: YciI family protein [Myxococcota bacterium]|nr:YciI family protein [Myxococcota bacterium]